MLLCAAAGDGCYSPRAVSPFTSGRMGVGLQSFSSSSSAADDSSPLSVSLSLSVTLGVVGGQLCLARSLVEVSL